MAPLTAVKTNKLTRPQGDTKVGSVRSPHRDEVASTLTPRRLNRILRDADAGNPERYLVLAQEMEERDPHYRSVLHTRKMAVSGVAPVVELPDDSSDSRKLGEAVEKRLVQTAMFERLVYDLLDGLAKGFSCVEIVWKRDVSEWYPVAFEFREQRHFVFDADTMSTPMLRTDQPDASTGLDQGVALNPWQWIVHVPRVASGVPVRAGIARTCVVSYAAKRWAAADWMAYLDIFGIPIRLGKYPAAMREDRHKLLRAAQALGSDAAAVIPAEMQIELIETKGQSGNSVFREAIEYWDKQTSKAVLGQTMTTDDGSSLAQSKTHEHVRWDIRDADARAVCATLDEQLIKPFILLNFGEQVVYPRVSLREKRPEDLEPLMRSVKLFVDLGGKVQASEVRDRLGLAEPEEDAELLAPKAAPAPIAPPVPSEGDDDSSSAPDLADEDEEIEIEPDANQTELNSAQPPASGDYDATDDVLRATLLNERWRALSDTNVGRLVRAIQEADSYEEARALLDELAKDEGEVLDVGALVVSLARSTIKLRGVGDGTDEVKP